jgi:hypothetical protein
MNTAPPNGPGTTRRTRRTPGRARAAVCWGIGLFVLGQLGLKLSLDTWARALLDPDYHERLARLRGRGAEPGTLRVVMLGSSRSWFGLNAAALRDTLAARLGQPVRTHNFAAVGAGCVTELFLWRRLRRDGVRPDLLLVEVFPALLNANRPNHELSAERLPTEQLTWDDVVAVRRYEGDARPGLTGEWRLAQAVPAFGCRRALLRQLAPRLLPLGAEGRDFLHSMSDTGEIDNRWDWLRAQSTPSLLVQTRAAYTATFADYRLGGPGCQALRELLADCHSIGVPVVLVHMPEGPAFRSWYPETTHEQALAWMHAAAKEYGAAVVDAREWLPEEDFADSHHLLETGAAHFTERLGREVVLPRLLAWGSSSPWSEATRREPR